MGFFLDQESSQASRPFARLSLFCSLCSRTELPLAVRSARFLNSDGTTRADVFWSHPPGAFGAEERLVQVAAVQRDSAQRVTSRQRLHYLSSDEQNGFDAHSVTLPGASGRFSAARQWDEYGIRETGSGAPARFGPRQRLNVVRLDTLAPLRSNPAVLEMSDVLPILVPEETPEDAANGGTLLGTPYPLPSIRAEVPLGVFFEVYHLTYDANGRTRYTVEYEVARREEGGVFRLFRDTGEETATQATYTGSTRKAREYLALDLKAWDREGTLRVTVRLTDEVSGQETERTVTFDALPSGE